MKVAIDGPAGSGKSTVAKQIAKKRNLSYLDTGAMYRSVTFTCLEQGIDLTNTKDVIAVAQSIDIRFEQGEAGQRVFVNDVEVTSQIRTAQVDQNVSTVAAIPQVREAMVELQRKSGEKIDVVAEGRDIGTVVFPNAEVKVFLTADASARAHRRAVEREGGNAAKQDVATDSVQEQQILEDIVRRDKIDSTRETSPLVPAFDAIHIDSSNLSVDEVCAQIEKLMDKAAAKKASELQTGATIDTSSVVEQQSVASKDTGELYYETKVQDFPLHARIFLKVLVVLCNAYTKLKYRWTIENLETLLTASANRGVVVIMNHVSFLDPFLPACAMILAGRSLRPIYKDDFNRFGILHWALPRLGAIPVARGTADIKALRRAQRALQKGESILIYPEGTRIRKPDQIPQIHGGFALMAKMAKADIIPMAIVGALDITPPGKHYPRPKKVYCRVGEPLSFKDIKAKGRKEQVVEMERVATQKMYELRDQLRAEHPGRK
ncbi:(d)CMP kinase [Atopobium fossor]|uniref:(d)CMP kinase n=1 Tax=Atopobium fossor TaxID=39487 RepID=UPI000420F9A6|nr:(d)CMP kinase [Atopobium fossor]